MTPVRKYIMIMITILVAPYVVSIFLVSDSIEGIHEV